MRFAIRELKNVEHELREAEMGQNALVFRLLLLLMFEPANLKSTEMTTALKAQRCDQPLDLRSVKESLTHQLAISPVLSLRRDSRLMIRLGILLLLGCDLAPDNVLAHVVLLGKVEKLADFGRTLGTKTLGQDCISETRKLIITLLDDDE